MENADKTTATAQAPEVPPKQTEGAGPPAAYEKPRLSESATKILRLFKPISEYPEEEAEWLVKKWIPKDQITLISSDGGIGKTSMVCNIMAAKSKGVDCVLDSLGTAHKPMTVMFCTTEDSIRKKIKKKLRVAGANMNNIVAPDFSDDKDGALRKMKFGEPEMAEVIRTIRPGLCVFDPVQGFTPPKVNMGSRNEMRDCLAPLAALGEECGTTFIILSHTNKRKYAYGRDRIADSADLWDISRSVIMAGMAEDEGTRYLSNEKNNYAPLQETILFKIDDNEQIRRHGTSWKHDRDYVASNDLSIAKPKREDCKEFIMSVLDENSGNMKTRELEDAARKYGYSYATIRRAKEELSKNKDISYYNTGSQKDKTHYIRISDSQE